MRNIRTTFSSARAALLSAALLALSASGIFDWPGQCFACADNSDNVRQMAANSVDLSTVWGAHSVGGTPAAQAVDRLNADKSKLLPQTSFVTPGKGRGGGNGSPQQ